MTRRPIRCALALLTALLALPACGPPPRPRAPSDSDLRSITEAQALEIIAGVLQDQGARAVGPWDVTVDGDVELEVDIRLGDSAFGVEWVSPQDRADHGDDLPAPVAGGQLRVVPGAGSTRDVQVLLVDHVSYRYDPERARVQQGSTGVREAEARLQSDIRSFLEYVRGQGGI